MTAINLSPLAPSANYWPIIMRVRTRDGRFIETTWLNGPEFSAREDQVREYFICAVRQHGGQIVAVEPAPVEAEHPLSRTVRRYREAGRVPA